MKRTTLVMFTVTDWLGYTIAIVDSPVDAYRIARLHIGATITPTAGGK